MKRLVELAEALNAPVVDIGGRMNFPTTHYLCRSGDRALTGRPGRRRSACWKSPIRGDSSIPSAIRTTNTAGSAKPDVKVIHISLGDTLTKSNYQDMQRFMPVDLADLRRCPSDPAGIDRGGEERHEYDRGARAIAEPHEQTARTITGA